MNKRIVALIALGIFFFAEAIYEIFFARAGPLAWVLLGPGLAIGPLAVWVAWRKYRESKRPKSRPAESATLNSND